MNWKQTTACTLAALMAGALFAPPALAGTPTKAQIDTLIEAYTHLAEEHYSGPDADRLLQSALEGMIKSLGDPFTNYMSPAEFRDFSDAINQQYAGIGTSLSLTAEKSLQIDEVFPKSPAEAAGLRVGDRIIAVDGVMVTGIEDTARLRGKIGTTVVVTVRRGTAEPFVARMTRAEISLPTVTEQDLGDGISYVRISSFAVDTASEFAAVLSRVEARSPKGIMLDLRGNGGGYVAAALDIADRFLARGVIMQMHDEQGHLVTIDADPEADPLPLAILVDEHTASASEILAGALQQNGRAKLVGHRTFGKGTMQMPIDLPNGGILKLSVDGWLLPDGTSLNKVGLAPDVPVQRMTFAMGAARQQVLPNAEQSLTYQTNTDGVRLNGVTVEEKAPRVIRVGGTVYVPLRYTVEAFGNEVAWSGETSTVSFSLSGHKAQIQLGTGKILADGAELRLSDAVRVEAGSTYLSAEALEALTGAHVDITADAVTVRAR